MTWEQALIIGIVVGFILGAIVIRLMSGSPKQHKAVQTELEKTKEELEQYRSNISEHFKRSSALLNNMVKEYSQLYNHISKASHEFAEKNESLPNPFNFRVIEGDVNEVEEKDGTLPPVLLDERVEEEHIADIVNDENRPVGTGKAQPRDYSEGASGLLRTERKE